MDTPLASTASLTLVVPAMFIVIGIMRSLAALTLRFPQWGWSLLSGRSTTLVGSSSTKHAEHGPVGHRHAGRHSALFDGWFWIMLAVSLRRLPGERVRQHAPEGRVQFNRTDSYGSPLGFGPVLAKHADLCPDCRHGRGPDGLCAARRTARITGCRYRFQPPHRSFTPSWAWCLARSSSFAPTRRTTAGGKARSCGASSSTTFRNLAIKVQTCVRADAADKQRLGRWLSRLRPRAERTSARRRATGRLHRFRRRQRGAGAAARSGLHRRANLRAVRRPGDRTSSSAASSCCFSISMPRR